MNRLPWFHFYSADWIKGTRELSLQEKGAWIDLLSYMWESKRRGILVSTWQGLARMLGVPYLDCAVLITDMVTKGVMDLSEKLASVTDGNAQVTLVCRRMVTEQKRRESSKHRKRRYDDSQTSPQMTTNVTRKSQSQKSESDKDSSASSKNGDAHKPPASPPKEPKPLTEVQRIVTAWKMLTGYPKEDTAWDRLNFPRCSKSAKSLLDFIGQPGDVIDCMQDVYERLNGKGLTVTIETIVKHAADWKKDKLERRTSFGVLPS